MSFKGIEDNKSHTWRPPITRSSMNGIIAKKSTKFIGCLKNLHFLGEHINLTRYSIRKNSTIAFSESKNIISRCPGQGGVFDIWYEYFSKLKLHKTQVQL